MGAGEDEELFAAMLVEIAADADLFELTEDIRQAYRQEKVDKMLLGGFDGLLDFLFQETRPAYQTRFMDDAAAELSDWACFKKDTPSRPKITEIMNWKVGRNDPCPCGSGKKFKKCCLRRLEEWEFKVERNPGTERDTYPPVTGRGGRPGLADFYSQDAIAVDRLAYHALKLLKGPRFRQRTEEQQARRRAGDLLWEAFQEARRICAEHGLKTPEEFDGEYHVHYDCAEWLVPLLELLNNGDPRRREVEAFYRG